MPLTRQEKEQVVNELAEAFTTAAATIMTDFRGLTVSEMETLRDALHQAGVRYMVVKNSLARLAMTQVGIDFEEDLFDGPTAVAFAGPDIIAAARAINNFARDARTFAIRGGMLNGRKLSAEDVGKLANLPGVEELRARLVGALMGPLYGLVGVFAGSQRGLIQVLRARTEQLGEAA